MKLPLSHAFNKYLIPFLLVNAPAIQKLRLLLVSLKSFLKLSTFTPKGTTFILLGVTPYSNISFFTNSEGTIITSTFL